MIDNTTPTPAQAPDGRHSAGDKAFNLANYFGLGWAVNSSLSLYITYNLLPTPPVQNAIKHLEGGIRTVMTGGLKAMHGGHVSPHQLRYVGDKARSAAEICCMCISGTLLLMPMKLMEDNKEPIVNWFNRKWYGKTAPKDEDGNPIVPVYTRSADETPGWTEMLKARATGIGVNLGVDQALEAFNNNRHAAGLPNLDSAEWSLGSRFYDWLAPATREGFSNFFDRHHAGINSIQPMVQDRLRMTVGPDPKRMVFAEQSRLFLKETVLTLLLAGVVFSSTNFFSKQKAAKAAKAAGDAPEGAERNTSLLLPSPGTEVGGIHIAPRGTEIPMAMAT